MKADKTLMNKAKCILAKLSILHCLLGCETSRTQNILAAESGLYLNGCTQSALASEPDWVFIKCAITNNSGATLPLQFAPIVEEHDEYFSIPSVKDTKDLQKRIENKGVLSIPNATPLAASDRPETFIFSLLVTIIQSSSSFENNKLNLQGADPRVLKKGQTEIFDFPLMKKRKGMPEDFKLTFTAPFTLSCTVPILEDLANARRRPIQ